MINTWQTTSFGRIRKVPPSEGARWRNERTLYRSELRRDWFPDEVDRLYQLVESGHSYGAVAKKLKRTRTAVRVKTKRVGVYVTTTPNTMSARDVADALGLGCSKIVTRWIAMGLLQARNGGDTRPLWRITWDDLTAFMERRETWMAWKPERIRDLALREWALELRADPHRWLTPGQVARRMYVNLHTVNTWIHKALLPAVRYGNWWIWSGDLVGFEMPGDQPYHKKIMHPGGLPARCLEFLRAGHTGTAQEFAEWLDAPYKTTAQALRSLLRRGLATREKRVWKCS